MIRLENVRIPGKIGILLALPLILAVVVGAQGLSTVFDLDQTAAKLVDVTAAKARLLSLAAENNTRLYQLVLAAIVEPDGAADVKKEADGDIGEITSTLEDLRPLIASDEQKDFSIVDQSVPALTSGTAAAIAQVVAGNVDGAKQLMDSKVEPAFDALDDAFDSLKTIEQNALAAAKNGAHTEAITAAIEATAVFVIGLMLVAAAGFWLSRGQLVRPIRALEQAMAQIAGGTLDALVPGTSRRDELGGMARAVEVFRANGQKVRELAEAERANVETAAANAAESQAMAGKLASLATAAARGDFAQRMPTNYALHSLNGVAGTVNALIETIARGLGETGEVLAALAQTDLTRRITGDYEGAFLRLKEDTNAVAERLASIIGGLKLTSSSLKNATGEIATGASDLAERTAQQAANVQEVSTSMDQLGSRIETSTRLAGEASEVAASVMTTTDDSVHIMGEAGSAMERITASSGKISNIIGLIDDIAFQTNLLALNASVEAARAGEAGKGFAVVAVEVRRLAQSAANASSEVKSLIEASATEVNAGGRLVTQATARLNSMLDGIRRNRDIIEAMARDAAAQADTIVAMTTSVRAIDQMTQHNAGLVEETSAAIEQTRAQAAELDGIVEVFTVSDRAIRHAQPQVAAVADRPATRPMSVRRPSKGGAQPAPDWTEF